MTAGLGEAAFQHVVERTLRMLLTQEISTSEAVSAITAAKGERALESTPAEHQAQFSGRLVAEYDRIGAGRDTAAKVAALFVPRDDPQGRVRVAQRVRALILRRNKARCRKMQPLRLPR